MNNNIKKGNIEGVFYKELEPYADDRGFFIEICKQGELFIPILQTSFTITHPGVIKAFHWHEQQTDLWFGASGRARAVLYDLRENSQSHKKFDVFYLGEPNYICLLIPPRVAHGYQVLGNQDFNLFYHTDITYNKKNPDEKRIKFDELGFDWSIKNR